MVNSSTSARKTAKKPTRETPTPKKVTKKKPTLKPKVKKRRKGMTQIKAHSKQGGLSEIYSTGLQFSFVSPNDEMCHAWVLCKDFLTDRRWVVSERCGRT